MTFRTFFFELSNCFQLSNFYCSFPLDFFLFSFCWHTCASGRVSWSQRSDPLLFSQGSAAPTLLFLWAGQGSFLAAFRQGSAIFLAFSGQQARCRCQVGGRHLPSVSYGQSHIQTPVLTESTVFAHLDRLVSLNFVSGRLSSSSLCSAALICVFCATRRIRFYVSDLFQK